MRRFVMTVVLACAIALTAVAGQVPTGGAPEPPPPAGLTQTTSDASPGDIPCDFAEEISEAGLSGLLAVLGFVV